MRNLFIKFIFLCFLSVPGLACAQGIDQASSDETVEAKAASPSGYLRGCQLFKSDGSSFTREELGVSVDIPDPFAEFFEFVEKSKSQIPHKFVCSLDGEDIELASEPGAAVIQLMVELMPLVSGRVQEQQEEALFRREPDDDEICFEDEDGTNICIEKPEPFQPKEDMDLDIDVTIPGEGWHPLRYVCTRSENGKCVEWKIKYRLWLSPDLDVIIITVNPDGTVTIRIVDSWVLSIFGVDPLAVDGVYLEWQRDGLYACVPPQSDGGETVCVKIPPSLWPLLPTDVPDNPNVPRLLPTVIPTDPGGAGAVE